MISTHLTALVNAELARWLRPIPQPDSLYAASRLEDATTELQSAIESVAAAARADAGCAEKTAGWVRRMRELMAEMDQARDGLLKGGV